MPGIFGLITNRQASCADLELSAMRATLLHEPFHQSGVWRDERWGVYAGWVAREGSFAADMPIQSERGDVTLLFAGQEFPKPGIRQDLKARGHSVELDGPEYLVHRYEEEGDFPRGLNGRFHGLVVDTARGTALLFNDRFGLQRLYYYQAKDGFYFASEAKAILAVRPELRELDARGLGEYITCGCVLENRTLFRGLEVLPPGSAWTFRGGRLEKRAIYFDPREWEEQEQLDIDSYYRELHAAFTQCLPRYFTGPERISMSLTGGLDGRMIMAWHRAAPGMLPCHSFASSYRDCEDARRASQIARMCGQTHHIIRVGDEFLARFPYYADRTVYATDGCADVSRSADLYLNEIVRCLGSARMTGNYGGEILRAVRAFKPTEPHQGLFRHEVLALSREAGETYARLVGSSPASFSAFRQCPWHHYGLLALEETQVSMRSPFLDNELVRVACRSPLRQLRTNDACLRLISEGDAALAKLKSDRGIGGSPAGMRGFLARAWLEGTFKAEYAYDAGMPQTLARIDGALRSFRIERLFLGRHKFCHYRVWYRDKLSAYVRDMLLSARALQRSYLDSRVVRAIIERHTNGTNNYTSAIHSLLSLELLQRLFVDSDAARGRIDSVSANA